MVTQEQLAAREAWVSALRDGGYPQAEGALHRPEYDGNPSSYCCLGVACATAGITPVRGMHVFRYDGEGYLLPTAAQDHLGLTEESPYVWEGPHRGYELTALNDSCMTFAEIADVIEAQPVDWDGTCVRPEED